MGWSPLNIAELGEGGVGIIKTQIISRTNKIRTSQASAATKLIRPGPLDALVDLVTLSIKSPKMLFQATCLNTRLLLD